MLPGHAVWPLTYTPTIFAKLVGAAGVEPAQLPRLLYRQVLSPMSKHAHVLHFWGDRGEPNPSLLGHSQAHSPMCYGRHGLRLRLVER